MVNFEIPPELADLDFDYAPSSAAFNRNSKSLLHYSTRQKRTNKLILNESSAITRQKETHKRKICESKDDILLYGKLHKEDVEDGFVANF